MTADPYPHTSDELLSELLYGGPGLPPARERWRALLTDPSPEVRLAAEVALLSHVATQHTHVATTTLPRNAPHRVPQFGITEPKRHCLRCFGHGFWVNGDGRLHCERCEPMPTV